MFAKTFKILWHRKFDALRCFWPFILYLFLVVALIALIYFVTSHYEIENIGIVVGSIVTAFVVIFLLAATLLTPAIIKWHRAIVLDEPIGLAMPKPSSASFKYAFVLLILTFAFVVIQTFLTTIWDDLLMPIVGLFVKSDSDYPLVIWVDLVQSLGSSWFSSLLNFSRLALASFVVSVVYVSLFRSLYLRLPEIALGQAYKGARLALSRKERWQFSFLLVLFFVFPEVVQAFVRYRWIVSTYSVDPTSTEPFVISTIVGIFSSLAAVTLLSVAILRAIERRGLESISSGNLPQARP
jgi:hypothetical protein